MTVIRMCLLAASVAFLTTANASAGLAGACQDDIAKIDAALSKAELAVDTRTQAEDMRNQAVQLCGAGNDEEGLAMTAEAKVLLAIE